MKHLKYFFFSDSHICDGTYKDDFSKTIQDDMRFIERLKLIKHKVDMIVGVGDIFELWQASHSAIKSAHFIVLKWLKEYVKLLKGNHDFSTFAPETMKFTTKSGKRVMASHAFQNNPRMKKWYLKAAIYIVGKLERWFPWLDEPKKHPKLYKLLPKKYRKVFTEKMHKVKGIEKDVEEYCKSFIGKVDVLICGHSHIKGAKVLKNAKGSILMLNCGDCTKGKFQGVLFDANNDAWEIL